MVVLIPWRVGCFVLNSVETLNPKYDYTAQRDDYLTPCEFYEKVLEKNGLQLFDCDVCCSHYNVPARFHYKKDGLYQLADKISAQDGLSGDWFENNWCNPPFPLCRKFIIKAVKEQEKGNTTFMLVPARTETKYWHDYILQDGFAIRKKIEVQFLRKGICFLNPDTGHKMPVFKNSLALLVFRGEQQ